MECFKLMGKQLNKCEDCSIISNNLDIHHTKYDNATVYDLRLVCRACNLKMNNRHLV